MAKKPYIRILRAIRTFKPGEIYPVKDWRFGIGVSDVLVRQGKAEYVDGPEEPVPDVEQKQQDGVRSRADKPKRSKRSP